MIDGRYLKLFNMSLTDDLDFEGQVEKKEILIVLKDEAADISLNDVMQASLFLIEDAKFVQAGYREKFIESYIKGFLIRINELKSDTTEYIGLVEGEELLEALNLLMDQESQIIDKDLFNPQFFKIYKLISIYTTFVLDEPVHPVGTPFPGGFEVKRDGQRYSCPVKDKQKDNPGAVCGFCIAEQDEDV